MTDPQRKRVKCHCPRCHPGQWVSLRTAQTHQKARTVSELRNLVSNCSSLFSEPGIGDDSYLDREPIDVDVYMDIEPFYDFPGVEGSDDGEEMDDGEDSENERYYHEDIDVASDGISSEDESSDDCVSQASSDSDERRTPAPRWDPENIEFELEMLKALSVINSVSGWAETLRFFNWKMKYNVSDAAYDSLREELKISGIRIRDIKATRRYLQKLLGIKIQEYHRCVNNCLIFAGDDQLERKCRLCGEPRFIGDDPTGATFDSPLSYSHLTPSAIYSYIPLIPRLKLLHANREYTSKMRYPSTLIEKPWVDGIRDIWEGEAMKYWKSKGYFRDERTIALHFSTDGVQLFRNSTQEAWPFLVINLSLPPEERYPCRLSYLIHARYLVENFLPLGLCSGRSQPKDLDSFLIPFIDELRLLEKGVPAYDALSDQPFLLKAHLILVTGDTPGISKLFHLSGHNAKHPCRACKLEGVPYLNHYKTKKGQPRQITTYYYPPRRPAATFRGDTITNLDFSKLNHRSAQSYRTDALSSTDNPREATQTGVKGMSPLFVFLDTVHVPRSIPFDVMHLVYIGFVRDLCRLLHRAFFKEAGVNDDQEEGMSEKEWQQLGVDMSRIRSPKDWGRYPRDISQYIKGFKAEELSNFLMNWLLPLAFKRVSQSTYRALQRFVFAMLMATSPELRYSEIDEIEKHLALFLKWFYNTYYQQEPKRLPVCKYTVHALMHLVDNIRTWSSACYFWQFPEERLCGILVSAIKSRVNGAANLTIIMHQHQLLNFGSKFGIIPSTKRPQGDSFTIKGYNEGDADYSFLSQKGRRTLTRTEFTQLQQHYRTIFMENGVFDEQTFIDMDINIDIWHRCRVVKEVFHCKEYERSKAKRLNYLARITQWIDKNARVSYKKRSEDMITQEDYVYIQFYGVHQYDG